MALAFELCRCKDQPNWTILDTGFAEATLFLDTVAVWRAQGSKPAMLHYVGLLSLAEADVLATRLQLARSAITAPSISAAAAACKDEVRATLASQAYGLGVGFHRILLQAGQISLTLCVGELGPSMAQLDLRADTVWAVAAGWDKWALKALARCCKRGTQVYFSGQPLPTPALLLDAGFQLEAEPGLQPLHASYKPRWQLRSKRRAASEAGRCAVIGAGIAGASVARALALRGWQVDVYDSQDQPAGAAAGLPVGLVVPHHSADDSPRSRLSRGGTRLMLQHASERLCLGQDWQPGGVIELNVEATGLAEVEAEVLSHARPQQTPTGWARRGELGQAQGLWHPYAAWIKPARLVQAWLEHPGIHFHGSTSVHSLQRVAQQWTLTNAQGLEVGRADRVVFANAYGCAELLQRLAASMPADLAWVPGVLEKLQSLQAMQGTLSLGPFPAEFASTFPGFPVNGHGSLVSGVPTAQGLRWYAGSTFQTDATRHADLAREHGINQTKLRALLPTVAELLAPQFANHQVQAWQGTRCISHDRLPLVGALDDAALPTLWICAAMGARGLSFSALCAELLAAWLGDEPLPMESNLAKLLASSRPQRKKQAPSACAA